MVFYLDDDTVGECVNDVIHDFQLIEEAGQLGLKLKTKIIIIIM